MYICVAQKEKSEMETKDETIQIRVEPTLKKELQKLADADNRKLADYVRLQLIKLVDENKKKK